MVPRGAGFGHAGGALGKESRQQHRGFDLCTGDRGQVVDAPKPCAGDGERSQISPTAPRNGCAHLPQRSDDPPHGPSSDRFVPRQDREKRLAGQHTGEQANAGTAIPAVQDLFGLSKPIQALAPNPQTIRMDLDRHP